MKALLTLLFIQVCFGANLPIYKPVSSYACTTLGDSEKSIGCTSSRGGDTGPLWPIETEDDFNDFINNHGSPKKILVINSTIFTKDRVQSLIATNDVAGILVTEGPAPSSGFSPVSQFPNKQYGLHSDSDYIWNPLGDEFAFEFFKVPMAALSSRQQSEDAFTSDDILTKARINKIEGGYPQWAVTLDTWMHSSGDADVCIPRGQCQPLGGKSVWSSLGGNVNSSKKLVFVSTSLDSNAFFHDLAIGADAHIASVITILLTVNTLARVSDVAELDKQIVFGLFAGESWGYLGSNRFVNDVANFKCKSLSDDGNSCVDPYRPSLEFQKIKLSNVDLAIDIDQIGKLSNNLFVHKEKTMDSNEITKFITLMQEYSNSTTVQLASTSTPGIPPSSLMPFIKNDVNYPGIVLADYNEQYSNKYYHSRFDNIENLNVDSICNLATILSKSLYSYASANNSKYNSNITVDCNLAKQLVNCLTVNMSCDLSSAYLEGLSFDSQPTQYTSVWSQNLLLSITAKFIHDVMAGLTATKIGDDCQSLADCSGSNDLCLNGKCISSTTYYHDALSLAFELGSSGWSINNANGDSTWTESNWDAISIKVFQMDSPVTDVVVFVFGIINILASVVVVYLLRQYLEKRFKSS